MAEFNLPPEDQMREALHGATKPTEWRRVIKLPEGTVLESYGIDGSIEVSVQPEYDVRIVGPGYPETTDYIGPNDYRDGQWHGWNGGECPVDPDDILDGVVRDSAGARVLRKKASWFYWDYCDNDNVIAFRVVSRKPREYTDDDGVTWREVTG